MNEITKLYENVGIKPGCCKYAKYGYEGEEGTWYYCKKEGKECWTYPHGNADCIEKGYPEFTAEKQIELIKWMMNKHNCYDFDLGSINSTADTFEEGIASVINNLWHFLTEEEKQQVKGILE